MTVTVDINTNFDGKVFQVIEALDYGDAVSQQVLELDLLLRELGFSTAIYSKWCDQSRQEFRLSLDQLQPAESDVVLLHYVGYSEHTFPCVSRLYCTKVFIYHNITPHGFFKPGSSLYDLCFKGRQQLAEIAKSFHYFWGDSHYNLEEIIQLGVNPQQCSVVPIVISPKQAATNISIQREQGSWIFLGRIAPNKRQDALIRLFAEMRSTDPDLANKLYLVGGFQKGDSYHSLLLKEIERLNLAEHIILAGKVSDAEVENYLKRASLFVSMSEHEGFGVPLIEASYQDLAVLALNNTAIGETLGESFSLATSPQELKEKIRLVLTDADLYRKLLGEQKSNAQRFTPAAVKKHFATAMAAVLPKCSRFTTVSIVICTYNRAELLERCLEYLQYQTNLNFEVVVINGPSTDHTNDVLESYKEKIKIGYNSARNLSISRNLGIQIASGDLIAFIDDDALPFDDWVDTLIQEFSRRPLTLAALGGPVYYAGTLEFQAEDIGINQFAEIESSIDSKKIGQMGWHRSLLGTNTCFRADTIRNVGGFDEEFDYYLDESELCFRLQAQNYIVGYCPQLFVRHEFAQSSNRASKYDYNWFSICKNTAYFIALYSGLEAKELSAYVDKRINLDRVLPLQAAQAAKGISSEDYHKFVEQISAGISQGLTDAENHVECSPLVYSENTFWPFSSSHNFPVIGSGLKRLHICILTKEFPGFAGTGGIGTLYYHLASEMLLMGHYVTVITPASQASTYRRGRFLVNFSKRYRLCSPDTLEATKFSDTVDWSLSAFHALAELHAQHPIDVVESALWDSEALAIGLMRKEWRPPLVLRLVTPFPVAARLNGWTLSEQELSLFKAGEKTLIEKADAVVPISEAIANTIEAEYDLQRDERWRRSHCGIAYWPFFHWTLNYTELKEINGQALEIDPEAKIVLFLGRLESRKGVDILLAAANQFLASDSQVHLLLAGRDVEGWGAKAATLLSQAVASRVHFLGEVDDPTREKLLHAAYCLVFPSRYESFGLVPLEAFVHGVPVIASEAGAIPEVVSHGGCGLLFPPGQVGALADCVEQILQNPQLRAQLSTQARQQVKRFSSRNSAIRAVNLYADLLKRRQSANLTKPD